MSREEDRKELYQKANRIPRKVQQRDLWVMKRGKGKSISVEGSELGNRSANSNVGEITKHNVRFSSEEKWRVIPTHTRTVHVKNVRKGNIRSSRRRKMTLEGERK